MRNPISTCSTSPLTPTRTRASGRVWKMQGTAGSAPSGSFSPSLKHGMGYRVNITLRAERDLEDLCHAIGAGQAALAWYRGFKRAILGLESYPNRSRAPPSAAGLARPRRPLAREWPRPGRPRLVPRVQADPARP